jgi:phosphoribosylanthranilate isomerase
MKVKICGLTNEGDVLAAVEAGADYLGFNFYAKSPRLVTAEKCAALVRAARAAQSTGLGGTGVKTVGVFVNMDALTVTALMEQCGLDLAQLHGDEGLESFARLRGRAYVAVRDGGHSEIDHAALAEFSGGEPAFLMDAYSPGAYGGTGKTGDWNRAEAVARRYPIFLAGGLTPENVGAAVEAVRPWGVDVASGVESGPGIKDAGKMREFVARAKGK